MKLAMPKDAWGPWEPRWWQADSLPKLITEYNQPIPGSNVVRAVTGSGKSKSMAQLAACAILEPNECIVVSTPSKFLVEQLEDTFRERLEGGFMSGTKRVGTFYTDSKDYMTPIIICCTPSLEELAKRLEASKRRCALWICDEVHRSYAAMVVNGIEKLRPLASLGYGATPYRAKWSESLHLFDQLIYEYKPEQAIKYGDVVPFRAVFWNGGEGGLDDACISMTELADGPGMYNAVSIDDADMFAIKLNEQGIPAQSIHSRMPKAERKKRIEDLRTGKLRALIHVSILQEGADLPWLRWLCMRRPVTSRVRFIQEIGRVIRGYTDKVTGIKKTEAVLYDPHGLLQDFSMTYDEVLGGEREVEEDDEEEKPSQKKKKVFEQLIFEVMRELVNVRAGKKPLCVTPLAAYLTELTTAFDLCQLIDSKITSREWRQKPATEKQATGAKYLSKEANRACVPKVHRAPLKMLADTVGKWSDAGQFTPMLSRGLASDLTSVLMSLADKKSWPDLKVLDRSAEDSMRAHEQRQRELTNRPATAQQIVLPHQKVHKKEQGPQLF